MNEEILINGDMYVFDIDKIMEYVEQTQNKEIKEKEITDIFEYNKNTSKVELSSKANKEVTTYRDTQIENLKYDFIKTLVMYVCNIEDGMSFGINIAFNTLVNKGFLVKK